MPMEDKMKFDETVSELSVQDILDEINAENIYGDDTYSVKINLFVNFHHSKRPDLFGTKKFTCS